MFALGEKGTRDDRDELLHGSPNEIQIRKYLFEAGYNGDHREIRNELRLAIRINEEEMFKLVDIQSLVSEHRNLSFRNAEIMAIEYIKERTGYAVKDNNKEDYKSIVDATYIVPQIGTVNFDVKKIYQMVVSPYYPSNGGVGFRFYTSIQQLSALGARGYFVVVVPYDGWRTLYLISANKIRTEIRKAVDLERNQYSRATKIYNDQQKILYNNYSNTWDKNENHPYYQNELTGRYDYLFEQINGSLERLDKQNKFVEKIGWYTDRWDYPLLVKRDGNILYGGLNLRLSL